MAVFPPHGFSLPPSAIPLATLSSSNSSAGQHRQFSTSGGGATSSGAGDDTISSCQSLPVNSAASGSMDNSTYSSNGPSFDRVSSSSGAVADPAAGRRLSDGAAAARRVLPGGSGPGLVQRGLLVPRNIWGDDSSSTGEQQAGSHHCMLNLCH
jgi:hypothetical protein